jgi:type IV secretory pathway component VirB8
MAKRTSRSRASTAQELIGAILGSATKATQVPKELVQTLSNDMIMRLFEKTMEKIDPRLFIDEVLTRYDVEVSVKVSLQPKKKKT